MRDARPGRTTHPTHRQCVQCELVARHCSQDRRLGAIAGRSLSEGTFRAALDQQRNTRAQCAFSCRLAPPGHASTTKLFLASE